MTERDDYKTILTNHTFANNANLTSEPAIHLVSDSLASSSKGNGVIEIGEFRRIQVEETYNTRHTTFAVAHKISFRGQTTDTKIQALIEEIQNAYDTNNQSSSRSYYCRILNDDWNGLTHDVEINLISSVRKEWESLV